MATVTANKVWVSGEVVNPAGLNSTAAPTVVVADGEVTSVKILDGAVTNAKLGTDIDAGKLTAGTLPIARIADDAITNDKLTLGANAGEVKKALNADNAPPIYACRAWVSFDGTAANNLAGTYTRTGTDVTVSATAHGLIVGNVVRLDFTGGAPTAAADGTYTVSAVDDANTFHVTTAATGTSSGGTVSILRRLINGAGNVSSVTYLNTAGDYVVNFAVAMPDVNYAVTHGGRPQALIVLDSPAPTEKAFYLTSLNAVDAGANFTPINFAVFR